MSLADAVDTVIGVLMREETFLYNLLRYSRLCPVMEVVMILPLYQDDDKIATVERPLCIPCLTLTAGGKISYTYSAVESVAMV